MRLTVFATALLGAALLAGCTASGGGTGSPSRSHADQPGAPQAGITDPAQCGCSAGNEVCVPSLVTSAGSLPSGAVFSCVAHDQLTDCTVDSKVCGAGQKCVTDFGCTPQRDPSATLPPDAGAGPESAAINGCPAVCVNVQQAAGEGQPCTPRDPDSSSLQFVCADGLYCVPSAVTLDGYLVDGATATCQSAATVCTDTPWVCGDEPLTVCIRDLSCNPDLDSLDCQSICAPVDPGAAD